jgi:hypothetical protein
MKSGDALPNIKLSLQHSSLLMFQMGFYFLLWISSLLALCPIGIKIVWNKKNIMISLKGQIYSFPASKMFFLNHNY